MAEIPEGGATMRKGQRPLAVATTASGRGFTLVELVVTLILIGILAVAVLPRFAERSVFEARGFSDETAALLRYAQKSAVAQRRTVCVTLGAGGVALNIASVAGSAVCDTALALPATPHGGSGLAASVGSFSFTALGATDKAADITITIAGGSTLTVDHKTGYVR